MTNETIKIPCPSIDRILTAKKLSEQQLIRLINKLRKIIKLSKPGNLDIIDYVKTVIAGVLIPKEVKEVNKIYSRFDPVKQYNEIRSILAFVYNSIVEVYPHIRMELICDDINGFLTDNGSTDEEFDKFLSGTKSGLSTIEDIKIFEKVLLNSVIGQDVAIASVIDSLKLKAAGFCVRKLNTTTSKSVPLVLMFVGKSGVGKTYTAKLLGEQYSKNFWQINCAEFSHGHEINRLLGSPPGYIGGDKNSILKEKSAKSNKWVILFDEVEKAQDKLYNLMLSWMETGIICDNSGNECDFSESFFIMTTNSGVRDLKTKTLNWNSKASLESTREELEKAIEHDFSPEFRGRIDEFVYFNELSKEDASRIAELRLKDYPVKRTKELIDFVVSGGFSTQYGAREISKFIKKNIALPLADTILAKRLPKTTNAYELSILNGKVEVVNTL